MSLVPGHSATTFPVTAAKLLKPCGIINVIAPSLSTFEGNSCPLKSTPETRFVSSFQILPFAASTRSLTISAIFACPEARYACAPSFIMNSAAQSSGKFPALSRTLRHIFPSISSSLRTLVHRRNIFTRPFSFEPMVNPLKPAASSPLPSSSIFFPSIYTFKSVLDSKKPSFTTNVKATWWNCPGSNAPPGVHLSILRPAIMAIALSGKSPTI